MPSVRESLIKLSGLGVAGSVALAAHHFGAGAATEALGGGMALLGMVAEASFGHIGLECVHDFAHRFGGGESARGRENRDLHRLIGETIARVLDESVDHAPVKLAAAYLKDAAKAFRSEPWMNVELTGPEAAVAEPGISTYFSGDAEAIKNTPVLQEREWSTLVSKVFAPTQIKESQEALDFAAAQLRERFAFELWESLKLAWKNGDLAWPALVLRILSELLGHARLTAAELPQLRQEIVFLRNAVLQHAAPAMSAAQPEDAVLAQAIREYQDKLTSQLDRVEGEIRDFRDENREQHTETHRMLRDLATVRQSRPTLPFQAPPKSDRYVTRSKLHAQIKAALTHDEGTSRPPVTRLVLHGGAGTGKTSLAIALCHDLDVRRVYPDGVLWVSLGQAPNLLQLQSSWGWALDDSQARNVGYPDVTTGVNQLRTLLCDRACLLVVDDAWEGEDVASAFLVGGSECALIVTTRQAEVAQRLNAIIFDIEGLAETEARALLEMWVGPLQPEDVATSGWLSSEVGYLPLALELIAARITRGLKWTEYKVLWDEQRLAALKRGRRSSGRADSVEDSIDLSVKALPSGDRAAYLQLAVFPPDEPFTPGAASALWSMSESEASELLMDLADQALVSHRKHEVKQYFVLHALLHEYIRAANRVTGQLSLHRALIGGYRKQCPDGWIFGKDDGYFFEHLSYHLAAAEELSELYGLVERRWMQRQVARGAFHRFAQDVELALSAACREHPPNWPKIVRCQQVLGSIRAQSGQISASLIEALARMGRGADAFNALALVPSSFSRARSYCNLGTALVEAESFEFAANAFRSAVSDIETERTVGPVAAEQLTNVARGLQKCGLFTDAKALLAKSNALVQSEPRLMNRTRCWKVLAKALMDISGETVALDHATEWLRQTEAAHGADASYGIQALGEVLASIPSCRAELLDGVADLAVFLRQQGHGGWEIENVIVALATHGALAKAFDLLAQVEDQQCIRAAAVCIRAARRNGDDRRAESAFERLCRAIQFCATNGKGLDSRTLSPAREIVVDVMSWRGFERISSALNSYHDAPWYRCLALSELAAGAASLGDIELAKRYAAEAARTVVELAKAGPVSGSAILLDAAELIVQAGDRGSAIVIIESLSSSEDQIDGFSRIAPRLLKAGHPSEAAWCLEMALKKTQLITSDKDEIRSACEAAQHLWKLNRTEAALGIAQRAEDSLASTGYYAAGAYARVARMWDALGNRDRAIRVIRKAVSLQWENWLNWDEEDACLVFEVAIGLEDGAHVETILRNLDKTWTRKRAVLAGVIKGLVSKKVHEPASHYFDEVQSGLAHYVPWNEAPKAQACIELAQLNDQEVLDWIEKDCAFDDPGFMAAASLCVSVAWKRQGRDERAAKALNYALSIVADTQSAHLCLPLLARASRELAASMPGAALLLVKALPEKPWRKQLLDETVEGLVENGRYEEAISITDTIISPLHKSQMMLDVAERIADRGQYDLAVKCLSRPLDSAAVAYIAAAASRALAVAQTPDRALQLLQQSEVNRLHGASPLIALALARRAQALALLRDSSGALTAANSALSRVGATDKSLVWAWCAEAFIRAGHTSRGWDLANRVLDEARNCRDDWTKVTLIQLVSEALVAHVGPQSERILHDACEIRDEHARGYSLGKIYPHLRGAESGSVNDVLTALKRLGDQTAIAEAIAALAPQMQHFGEWEELHRLLGIVQEIEDLSVAASAVGPIAAALTGSPDPTYLAEALALIKSKFHGPSGLFSVSALAMTASALKRNGYAIRSDDLSKVAFEALQAQEVWALPFRVRHAVQSAISSNILGDRIEADRQADRAYTLAAHIRSHFPPVQFLLQLSAELGAPKRFDQLLDLLKGQKQRLTTATSEAAIRLAETGHRAEALNYIRNALSGAIELQADDMAIVYGNAASALRSCGDAAAAEEYLCRALSHPVSRAALGNILSTNVGHLSSLNDGATLVSIYSNIHEVNEWW